MRNATSNSTRVYWKHSEAKMASGNDSDTALFVKLQRTAILLPEQRKR